MRPECLDDIAGLQRRTGKPDPVVYFLCFRGEVVYVGMSVRLERRLLEHAMARKEFDDVYFVSCRDVAAARRLERRYAKQLRPKLNVQMVQPASKAAVAAGIATRGATRAAKKAADLATAELYFSGRAGRKAVNDQVRRHTVDSAQSH